LGAQSHPSDQTGLTAAQGQQLSDHSRSSDSRMRQEEKRREKEKIRKVKDDLVHTHVFAHVQLRKT